jgi:hypothetical protein
MAKRIPGSPLWQSWARLFEKVQGCPFRAAMLTGGSYRYVMMWRAAILGPTWKRRHVRAALTSDQLRELDAALEAGIPLGVMATRFNMGKRTLIYLIDRYGLERPYARRRRRRLASNPA